MVKEQFDKLDLREQLTDDFKLTWYYKKLAPKVQINKHDVVFDNSVKFNLTYVELEELNVVKITDKDGKAYTEGFEQNSYSEDEYSVDPQYILEDIFTYIVNNF